MADTHTTGGRGRRRRAVKRTVAALVGLLVALLVSEVAVRLMSTLSGQVRRACRLRLSSVDGYQSIKTLHGLRKSVALAPEPNMPWNGFILNSHGLRTPEYEAAKRPGTFRVVALGDSFTFDSGEVPYPLHYTVLVQKGLARALGKPVEMINLAIPASGPLLQRRMLELEGQRLKPDLVIWTIFAGNDFISEFQDNTPLRLGGQDWMVDIQWLVRWSYLGRALRYLYYLQSVQRHERDLPPPPPPGAKSGTYVEDVSDYDPDKPNMALKREMFHWLKRQNMEVFSNEDYSPDNWLSIREAMGAAGRLCRQKGIPLLMVVIPDEVQVNRKLRLEVLHTLGRHEPAYDMNRPQRLLRAFFEKARMEYVDLLPATREWKAGRLYAHHDVHWNSRGNKLAADEILRYLAKKK